MDESPVDERIKDAARPFLQGMTSVATFRTDFYDAVRAVTKTRTLHSYDSELFDVLDQWEETILAHRPDVVDRMRRIARDAISTGQ